jgi:hypothetical protein
MAEPKAPASRNRLPDVARIVGGLVVVAIVVGVGLWAERMTDDDLALPDKAGGMTANDSAEVRSFVDANSKRLSAAYDGADAVTALYGHDLNIGMVVTAVREKSGPPVPAVFSKNQQWVEDGDVTCLVTRSAKAAGSTLCQRADGDLTVRVFVNGRPSLDSLVDATNDVWEDVL